jgi:NTE family protein
LYFQGAAHIGLLKAFEKCVISIQKVSGSSAGAIVGAMFCAGYTPDEILTFFKSNTQLFNLKHLLHNKPGLFNSDLKREVFEDFLPQDSFDSLQKELNICVTDVLKGKVKFFSSGELFRVLLASVAIPGIFTPVEIDGVHYFDGGTMNNFPVEPLTGRCDWLYGSYVSVRKRDAARRDKLYQEGNSEGRKSCITCQLCSQISSLRPCFLSLQIREI